MDGGTCRDFVGFGRCRGITSRSTVVIEVQMESEWRYRQRFIGMVM